MRPSSLFSFFVFKALLLIFLLIWFPVLGLRLVHMHMDHNSKEMERLIAWKETRFELARDMPWTQIDSKIRVLQSDQLDLQILAQGMDFGLNLVLVFILMLAFILYKRGWPSWFSAFDGLALFVAGFLFYTGSLFMADYFKRFSGSMNAPIGYLFVGGFGVAVVSSILGFWLNRKEIKEGQHKAGWINWVTGAAGLAGLSVLLIFLFLLLTTPTLPTTFG